MFKQYRVPVGYVYHMCLHSEKFHLGNLLWEAIGQGKACPVCQRVQKTSFWHAWLSLYYISIISHNVYFQWVRYQSADMATVATDTATGDERGGDPVMPLASPKCGHCEMTFSNISDLFHHMKVSGNITLFALWCLSKWNWQFRNCTCILLVYILHILHMKVVQIL